MAWRVTYTDLEAYAGGRPPQLGIILIKQPDGYDDQADPCDLPAEALDALRTWLVGAPTGLHVRPSEGVQEAQEKCTCPPGSALTLDTCPVHGFTLTTPLPLANPDRVTADTEEDTQS